MLICCSWAIDIPVTIPCQINDRPLLFKELLDTQGKRQSYFLFLEPAFKPMGTRVRTAMTRIKGDAFALKAASHTISSLKYRGDINDDALDQSVYQPGAAERAALWLDPCVAWTITVKDSRSYA